MANPAHIADHVRRAFHGASSPSDAGSWPRVYSQMRKGPGCGAGPPTSQGDREMPESFRTYRDVRLVSAKPLAARSPSLSPQEFFLELVPVGRGGCIKRIFECLKLRFFGLADFKSLIYCHIAVDHCR